MFRVKLMNKIADIGTSVFDKTNYEISDNITDPDALIVRSASLHEMEYNPSLLAIARAGAGVNNIPIEECAKHGVVVFNTPGANANAVKELAMCALILASRDVVGGVEWAKSLAGAPDVAKAVEAGKSKFSGREIMGKTLGVIGLGAIGGLVANTARALGMKVVGCDPYLTVQAAWSLSRDVHNAENYDEIYKVADYITLHVPSNAKTRGMINKDTISKMKDGVRIINLARADLVNTEDMKAALDCGKVAAYVTDFPTEDTIGLKNTVNIPHLGASTLESEDNCAVMAAEELIEFLETGNIRNSVNFPTVSIPHTGDTRICLLHLNVANMLSQITTVISEKGINIENLSNGSKGDFAYTIVEIGVELPGDVLPRLEEIDGIIKVRVI